MHKLCSSTGCLQAHRGWRRTGGVPRMSCLWSVHGQVEIRGKSLIQDRVQRQDGKMACGGGWWDPMAALTCWPRRALPCNWVRVLRQLRILRKQKSEGLACKKAPPGRWHCSLKPALSLLRPDQGSGREQWGLPTSSSSLGTSCPPSAQPAGKHLIPWSCPCS